MRWIIALIASASMASAQLIAYESFSAMPAGGTIYGSGADATGWTQEFWEAATSPNHFIGDQSPNMTYQITNGGIVSGGDRCAVLTTAPEPTGGMYLAVKRAFAPAFAPVNTTLYFSFLLRPLTIGTGSDRIRVGFVPPTAGASSFAVLLEPDQGQLYLRLGCEVVRSDGTSSGLAGGGEVRLFEGETYLVAGRMLRQGSLTRIDVKVNPRALIPTSDTAGSGGEQWNVSVLSSGVPLTNDRLMMEVYSADAGGPSTSVATDEIRIGYTWNDVVPQSTTQTVVPTLSIAPAVAVNWQSKTNKTYQPQRSYDLTNWVNFGSTIAGDGQQKSFLDSADQVPKNFYRVIEQ
jgi:hypothetical protein